MPFIFTNVVFWLFFTGVFLGYCIVYKNLTARSIYLFFISIFFYYKTSGLFVALLLFSTISDYFLGIAIYQAQRVSIKKTWLIVSILLNLALLGYFKYYYLLIDSMNAMLGTDFEVKNHFAMAFNAFAGGGFDIDKVLLPVGISFYTFQTLSYTIDIYRGKLTPLKSLFDFGFYVSFFPQLVAGPIVRSSTFVPQIKSQYKLSYEAFSLGLFLILKGLIKKIVLGDYIALQFIDRVFANPLMHSGFETLMALYGYSLQVYADFSGYTDMAIGLAAWMGFTLPANFNSPYKAQNLGDFWKRWHISLSAWLKDYLYIPLGGNRYGAFRTNVNLLITMLLGGLWHGANWKFVFWGGINGAGLLVYKAWKRLMPVSHNSWGYRFIGIIITFQFITFTRVWFRGESWENARQVLESLFGSYSIGLMKGVVVANASVFAVILVGYMVHWLPGRLKDSYTQLFLRLPTLVKVFVCVGVVVFVYQFYSSGLQPFIYFRF